MTTAIILSTYGEPTENTFGDQWMYSWRILRRLTRKVARIPTFILPIISTFRAKGRVEMWREADFVSPLEPLTDDTVAALRTMLKERGWDEDKLIVASSYEFRRPLLPQVVAELRTKGAERFVVVPMYMGTGDFTHGMTDLALEDARVEHVWLNDENLIRCDITDPATPWLDRLADVCADHVIAECRERGIELPATDWAICLAAHGSVQTPREGVDNGVIPFGELCWRIYGRLKNEFGLALNGWLNHDRGGRWTEPSVEALLPRLRENYDRLVYFPWGFTTDNAESALEGRLFCDEMENPFERVEHLPCLNATPAFIKLLADRVEAYLKESGTAAPDDKKTEAQEAA